VQLAATAAGEQPLPHQEDTLQRAQIGNGHPFISDVDCAGVTVVKVGPIQHSIHIHHVEIQDVILDSHLEISDSLIHLHLQPTAGTHPHVLPHTADPHTVAVAQGEHAAAVPTNPLKFTYRLGTFYIAL
jgi:hypothetical protein